MSAENTAIAPPVKAAPLLETAPLDTSSVDRKPSVGKILALGSMTALGPFTIDMYLPALPDIGADLGVSSSTVQLTITGTLIGLALGQLLVGPLSDTLGRKKPLLAGIGVHILASLLAVFAPSIAVLGILRVFQGMGAAAAAVVTMAIVRDLYSGNTVAVVMSRLMLVLGVAPILAPSIGGALLVALDWRGIFVVLALIGVGTAMIGAFGLSETLPKEKRRPSGLTSVLRTYGSLLGDRTFMVLTLVSSVGMASLFAYVSGASFVYQDQYGLNQQEFALLFSAGAIALIGASQVNVRLLDRWTPQQITKWAPRGCRCLRGRRHCCRGPGTGRARRIRDRTVGHGRCHRVRSAQRPGTGARSSRRSGRYCRRQCSGHSSSASVRPSRRQSACWETRAQPWPSR